jgi:hypothetical protein
MPRSFEEVVLPHLDAAFNYAQWLTKNDAMPRMSCRMRICAPCGSFPPYEARMPVRGC